MTPRDITLYFHDGRSMAIQLPAERDSRLALELLDRAHLSGQPVTLRVLDARTGELTRCTVDGAALAAVASCGV